MKQHETLSYKKVVFLDLKTYNMYRFNLTYYPFLKISEKSLKSYTFYLHQTKLIRGFSQKHLLLVLKTPGVLGIT